MRQEPGGLMVATMPTTRRTPPSAADALAAIEFLPPVLPPHFVDRQRLHPSVERAKTAPLSIVAAPPGAGKTTLFAHLAHTEREGAVAWCTLDAHHANAQVFGRAVLRAVLEARRAGDGADLATVRATSPDQLDQALQLAAHGGHLTFVLDNADVLQTAEARGGLQQLVHLAPPELSIVLLTRQDPDLRIDRIPADAVVHIRAGDLAFTEAESATLFDRLANPIDETDIRTLTRWTGGLGSSLALAAIATRDRDARARVLAEARGGDRAVCDYLTFEVLEHLPVDVRDFLLRTSIVEAVNRDLAATIGNVKDAGPLLTALSRDQIFLSTVDGWPGWYRYHRMFVEILRAAFVHTGTEEVVGAHRRAARWLDSQGLHDEALAHAVSASEWDVVGSIVTTQWMRAALEDAPNQVSPCVAAIPEDRRMCDPACALAGALWSYSQQQRERVLADLAFAEELDSRASVDIGLPAALLRVVVHMESTPASNDIDEAGDALLQWSLHPELSREEADAIATFVLLARSKARFRDGDLVAQTDLLEHAILAATESGRDVVAASATARLALVMALRGRLRSAVALNEELGELWATTDARLPRAMRSVTLAFCAYHRDDLPLARRALADARANLHPGATRDVVAVILAARLALSDGDPRGARRMLAHAAEAGCPGLFDLTCDALGIVAARDAQARRAVSHPYAIVRRFIETAMRAFEGGNTEAALGETQRALAIIDRHGYRRAFVDSELQVRALLTAYAAEVRPFRMIATQLLERLNAEAQSPPGYYVERLTDRELTVLRLLPTMMSNSEIAADLFFSVNTVKTHLKSIYRKLEVGRRRDAVQRARDLNLI